jgi:hypothetical protein
MTTNTPSNYHLYVSIQEHPADSAPTPYVLTTEKVSSNLVKMCGLVYVKSKFGDAALNTAWVKWEQESIEATDIYKAVSRYELEFNCTTNSVSVFRYEKQADGYMFRGSETRVKVVTFVVGSIPRFISPIKVSQFFEQRKQSQDTATSEAAAKSLAESLAIEAAAVVAASAPVVVVAPVVPPTPPALPVLPETTPPPSFSDALSEFTQ